MISPFYPSPVVPPFGKSKFFEKKYYYAINSSICQKYNRDYLLNCSNLIIQKLNMTYNHGTSQSYTPDIEFWRTVENIYESFPYWTEWNKYRNRDFFIKDYEIETKEAFDFNKSLINIPKISLFKGKLIRSSFSSKYS